MEKKSGGGNGRKKIEIKRIDKEERRRVCFTKRRQGLFKKAEELRTLCGADIGIVVFSLSGKPYFFGEPSLDRLLCRPTTREISPPPAAPKPFRWDLDVSSMGIEDLESYANILRAQHCEVQVPGEATTTTQQIVAANASAASPPPPQLEEEEDYFLWLQQQQDDQWTLF